MSAKVLHLPFLILPIGAKVSFLPAEARKQSLRRNCGALGDTFGTTRPGE